jgi:branched-chain amino acid transport system substrate-binding protein
LELAQQTETDHRPIMDVPLYRTTLSGPATGELSELMSNGTIKLEKIDTITLPRRPDWLGY